MCFFFFMVKNKSLVLCICRCFFLPSLVPSNSRPSLKGVKSVVCSSNEKQKRKKKESGILRGCKSMILAIHQISVIHTYIRTISRKTWYFCNSAILPSWNVTIIFFSRFNQVLFDSPFQVFSYVYYLCTCTVTPKGNEN